MRRTTIAKRLAAALLVAALSGLAHAVTSVHVGDSDLEYRGAVFFNSAKSATVTVRVFYDEIPTANVSVLVKALAQDGTTVEGSTVGQVKGLTTRPFVIVLPKPITSLVFVRIDDSPVH